MDGRDYIRNVHHCSGDRIARRFAAFAIMHAPGLPGKPRDDCSRHGDLCGSTLEALITSLINLIGVQPAADLNSSQRTINCTKSSRNYFWQSTSTAALHGQKSAIDIRVRVTPTRDWTCLIHREN